MKTRRTSILMAALLTEFGAACLLAAAYYGETSCNRGAASRSVPVAGTARNAAPAVSNWSLTWTPPRAVTVPHRALLSKTLNTNKPNILYILADHWRGNATGYAGDPNVRTPTLDRLAAQGVNLCNAVSVCPVCTPYRAALMTGRFPTSTGMFLNDARLPSL